MGGSSHFPSPTARGAGAGGRAPPARRALWTRPRGESSLPRRRKRQSRGWCCAEPGSAPVLLQGRRRARSGPGPRAQRAGHGGPWPAAWQPQVRRPALVPLPRLPPRTLPPPPPAVRCPLSLSRLLPRLGAGSEFFLFFPLFLSQTSLPSFLTFPFPGCCAILFGPCPTFPCPSSSASPFLPPALALELPRVALPVELTL